MDALTVLWFIGALFTKHFIVDFPLQGPYQYLNKGTYGHLGGHLHAALHGIGTVLVSLFFVDVNTALLMGLADHLIHYHVDWAKMNINKRMGWAANTHEQFWWLLGLDQFIHAMTYVILVGVVV